MFCSASRVWSPSSTNFESSEKTFAHCGSRILAQILERKKIPTLPLILIVIVVLFFGIFAVLETQELAPDIQQSLKYGLLGLAFLGILGIEIPLLLRSLQIFHSDVWVGIFLLSSLGIYFIRPLSHLELGLLLVFGMLWLALRTGEAYLWKKKLKKNFNNAEKDWSQTPASFANRLQVMNALLGLAVVLTVYLGLGWMVGDWIPHPSLALVMVIFTTPFMNFLVTTLLRQSELNGWLCRDFSFFRNLRKSKLIFFHSTGVLSSGELKVSQTWLENSDEWPKEDIREILVHLSHQSAHPISEAIRGHFPKVKKPLLELENLENHPHLGVTGIFRDIQRSKVTARLGSFSWHRVLQSEMSDEGRDHLKKWLDAGKHVCLLSLNETIVCGIAFDDSWKEIDGLQSGKRRRELILLSSTQRTLPDDAIFASKHYDSFPPERKNWSLHWMERIPEAIEVASWWDHFSDPFIPRVHFQALDRPTWETHKLIVYSRSVQGLNTVLKNSESFQRQCIGWLGLSLCLGIAAAMISPPFWILSPVIILFHGGALLWTQAFALQ